jgi:putative transposase
MPRRLRVFLDGVPLHVVNRGNRRERVFLVEADYLGFLGAIATAAERTTVRLLSYCLMPNHFHLVLWPEVGVEVPAYMQILMNAHIRDLQKRHGTAGTGHIYQGRYRGHAILSERHLLGVCRYVEANGLAAGLAQRAEQWPWSSLAQTGPAEGANLIGPWPVPKPADWLDQVNQPLGDRAWKRLKQEIEHSQPGGRCFKDITPTG